MFTGSFRPATGTRHLHRDYSFTGSLEETAPKSLRHSCRSELTRQGISLLVLLADSRANCTALDAIPACRHAEGTISSPRARGAWRMVSEDSEDAGGFPTNPVTQPAIHSLSC